MCLLSTWIISYNEEFYKETLTSELRRTLFQSVDFQRFVSHGYFFGKYLTPLIFLKSESSVHITASKLLAVAKMMLTAMGKLKLKLSFEAEMANEGVRSTVFP